MAVEVVTTHTGTDFDALASLFAASKLYPNALVFLPGSPESKVREYLHTETFPGRFSDFDEIKNEKIELLVVTDTRHRSRIGRLGKVVDKNTLVHLYDHHPETDNDMRAAVNEKKKYGATTTMLIEKLRKRKIPIAPHEATLLAMGIYEDTGCLTYPMTTPEDLQAVSYLLSRGADLATVAFHVIHTLKEEQIRLLNTFLDNKYIVDLPQGRVAFVSANLDKYVEDLSVAVQKAVEVLKPQALFALVGLESKVLCIMRSEGKGFNAGSILKEFGGGGHRTAASATFKNLTIDQVREKLLKELRKSNSRGDDFSLIKYPVKIIPEKDSAIQAYRALLHMGGEYAPVGDEEGNLRGIIEKSELEKAIKHGLAQHPVVEFVHSEIVSVESEDRKVIREKLSSTGSPFVLIKQNGRITGFAGRRGGSRREDIYPRKENLRENLRENLDREVCKILEVAAQTARQKGISIYCVGGMVRDIIMGIKHKDVDIVAEERGIAFARQLAEKLGGKLHIHKKFKTAVIKLPEREIDIATLRKEHYVFPAALPTVESGTLRQDLKRRDFSINAMSIQLTPDRDFGKLIDFFGGREDIETGLIKILYPLSFVEDPTRIFRAFRFQQRFGFKISPETMKQMKKSIKMDMHLGLSCDRVKEEILNIMDEKKPHLIFKRLQEIGALNYIHPDLKITGEVLNLLERLAGSGRYIAMMCALLLNLPRREGIKVLKKFNFSKKYARTYTQVKKDLPPARRRLERDLTPARIYKVCTNLSEDSLYILQKSENKQLRENIRLYLKKLRKVSPMVGGKKLMHMGYEPGPLMSEITNSLKVARLNGKLKTLSDEKEFIRENFPRG